MAKKCITETIFLQYYKGHILCLQCCDRLDGVVKRVDVGADIRDVAKQREATLYTPEQILIDCYVSAGFLCCWGLGADHRSCVVIGHEIL